MKKRKILAGIDQKKLKEFGIPPAEKMEPYPQDKKETKQAKIQEEK